MTFSAYTRAICLLALAAIVACVPPSTNATAYKALPPTRRPVEHTTTTGNVTPHKKNKGGGTYTESTSTSETARISVVAIAWKNAP